MFYYRHQAGGVLHESPFSSMPTDAELAPLRAAMLEKWGATHPKTGAAFWDRIEEVLAELDANGNAMIVAHHHTAAMSGNPAPAASSPADGGEPMRALKSGGKGHVKNPKP